MLSSILFEWCNTCLSFQTFVISLKSLEEQAFLRKDCCSNIFGKVGICGKKKFVTIKLLFRERKFFVLLEEFSTMTLQKCCHVILVNEIKKEYCDRIMDVISLCNFGNIQHWTDLSIIMVKPKVKLQLVKIISISFH